MTHGANVHAAVVGIPSSSTRGESYGKLQAFVRGYSQGVLAECGIKVFGYWDESFTTQLAKESFMKRSKKSARNRLSLRKRAVDAVCFMCLLTQKEKHEVRSNSFRCFRFFCRTTGSPLEHLATK